MRGWIAAIACLWLLPGFSQARPAGSVDAHAEVAAALYAASATQTAYQKLADAELHNAQVKIAALQVREKADASEITELAAEEEHFVDVLAQKDRAYAAAIAQFRNSLTDIAATQEGAAALARYNAGDEVGALTILDRLRAANDTARKAKEDIESAAEGRRIAELALDARDKGKVSTASVIARFEEVVKLDPGMFWDWVKLDRLCQDAGRLADARHAAEEAAKTAQSDRDKAVALEEFGDIAKFQGDFSAARKAHEESLVINRRMTARDPGDMLAFADLALSLAKLAEVLQQQGDMAGARKAAEESLVHGRRVESAQPGDREASEALSYYAYNLGDILEALGDWEKARKAYEESLAIDKKIAATYPNDAKADYNVATSLERVGKFFDDRSDPANARQAFEGAVRICRRLAAADQSDARFGRCLEVSLAELAGSLMDQGDPGAARKAFEEAISTNRRLLAADPGSANLLDDLAVTLKVFGDFLAKQNDLVGAHAAFDEAEALQRKRIASDPSYSTSQLDLEVSLMSDGDLLRKENEMDRAGKAYREALSIVTRLSKEDKGNFEAQRDRALILERLAYIRDPGTHWSDAVAQWESMQRLGIFDAANAPELEYARKNAAGEKAQ
jgi:tetratricopeptide (TPR) repeat protein